MLNGQFTQLRLPCTNINEGLKIFRWCLSWICPNYLSDKIILLPRLQWIFNWFRDQWAQIIPAKSRRGCGWLGKAHKLLRAERSLKPNRTTIKLKILQCTCFHLSLYNPEVLLILSVASTLSLSAKAESVIRMWSCFTEVTIKLSSQVHRSKPLTISSSKDRHYTCSCSVFQ